jgi:hypothetical protein
MCSKWYPYENAYWSNVNLKLDLKMTTGVQSITPSV